jgi:DNA-binding MarR family transcriptional regulator
LKRHLPQGAAPARIRADEHEVMLLDRVKYSGYPRFQFREGREVGETDLGARIAAVRSFNRFYTRRIGVLHEGLLASTFSLTEVRILYELAHRQNPTATDLCKDLGLDPGYLSRILRGFERRRLITRMRSATDGRQQLLTLTRKGQTIFAPLDSRAREDVAALLDPLSDAEQRRLIDAMRAIERLLGP